MEDEELEGSTATERIQVWRVWGTRAEEDGGWGARTIDIDGPDDPRDVGDLTGSGPWGQSWTTIDPTTQDDYRDVAGLPDENRGRFLSTATADPSAITWSGSASQLDGNQGGLDEVIIPDAEQNLELISVQGVNESWSRPAEPDAPTSPPPEADPESVEPTDSSAESSVGTIDADEQPSVADHAEENVDEDQTGVTDAELDAMDEATTRDGNEDAPDEGAEPAASDRDHEL